MCKKVAWVLQELNLPYDRIDAGGAYGGLDDAHYVAMNPNRRVPTLIEGDLVLWESNAICRYLVDTHDVSSTMKAKTSQQRAHADMWMEWFQNNVYVNSIALFYQAVRLPPSQRSPEKRESLLAELTQALMIFDAALEGRSFIAGDQFGLGDVATGAFLYRYFTMDIERTSLVNLSRYYKTLTERPAYRDGVMVDYSPLRRVDKPA